MSNLAIGYLGLASIFVLIALRVPVGLEHFPIILGHILS